MICPPTYCGFCVHRPDSAHFYQILNLYGNSANHKKWEILNKRMHNTIMMKAKSYLSSEVQVSSRSKEKDTIRAKLPCSVHSYQFLHKRMYNVLDISGKQPCISFK